MFTAAQFGQATANLFAGPEHRRDGGRARRRNVPRRGHGSPIQAALGAIFIALLQNFMLLSDLDTGWRLLLQGSIVAAAVSLYAISRRDAR